MKDKDIKYINVDLKKFLVIEIIILIIIAFIGISIGPIGPISTNSNLISFVELLDIIFIKNPLFTDISLINTSIIVWEIRIPRILAAMICGASLSISGVIIQTLFRNPLGDPYILGISSGASVGAALYFVTGLTLLGTNYDLTFFAFTGAIVVTFLLYFLAEKKINFDPNKILLVGISLSALGSALTMFIVYISSDNVKPLLFWLFGSFSNISWYDLIFLIPIIFTCILISYLLKKDFNVLLLGSISAHHLGINVSRTRKYMLILSSILTAITVAFTGVIGFVGLIVPHITRNYVGPNHNKLIPTTALAGAIFLLLSDITARIVLFPTEIPLGIITSFLGGIFFIYILLKKEKVESI